MDPDRRRPGFTLGDNAASAARKNHQFGTAHKFDSKSGSEAGRIGAERRWKERRMLLRDSPDRRQTM